MGVTAAVHPTDQILQCLRPGQARRCLGRVGEQTPGGVRFLPAPGCRAIVRRIPGTAAERPGQVGQVGRWLAAIRCIVHRRRPRPCRSAPAGRHPASRAGRPPRLRGRPRAGARRDGGGLPRREQAHGASGGAQGRRRALGRAARRARPVPPRDPVGRQAATHEYRRRLLGHEARREHRPRHGVRRRATTWRRW